jgi:hypothetical protein
VSRGINLKRVYPKVNRNDDCPCGSKKKFKYCCIKGEWVHDYIDVYHHLLKRGDSWADLNKEPIKDEDG